MNVQARVLLNAICIRIFTSVECIRHPPTYFAKRLHSALDRMNVDDDTLIRCIVGRSEVNIMFLRRYT